MIDPIPPIPETVDYVRKILNLLGKNPLVTTDPMALSDGH